MSTFGGLALAASGTGGRPSQPWRFSWAVHTAVDRTGERLGDLRDR